MFKIKRPAIIGLLLVLLVFTGYLNYQLTQQALLKASSDYQEHEELEIANYSSGDYGIYEEVDNLSKGEDKDITIVDSTTDEGVSEVISASNNELNEALETEVSGNINYFVEYRLSRDKLRANMVDRLEDIVDNTQTAEDVRTKAQEEIIKIGNVSEKELQIEGLVKSKGFNEALVFITDSDIKVVVSKGELTEQDMVKILDIVKSETTFSSENIKIMKKQ
ncbi:SpoIIIAH-like family protein [Tissierella sp. Yu-01]|uniref:SpoIIIAH-like family protein n=1 Tax=Tissierella sp. Yu-01 TaxID=3035694 RepID=UPI00240E7140|nr:SpoIIIAH-like family protein [Tissierella sp. Yu-01]WFA09695.1 SpoIIIAH-like family protein [Tissierella sp. Yu-01]